MPVYEYRCENDHVFDVIQRMVDDPIEVCETCGAPVQRVFHPVAVHFKGSGFYTTDYAKKKSVSTSPGSSDAESPSKDSGSDSTSSKDSSPDSSESKKKETTSSAKSGSGSD